MKFSLVSTLACLASASAFVVQPRTTAFHSAQTTATTRRAVSILSMAKSFDEEVEELVQKEINKTKNMSKMSNEKGMEYAPWIKLTPEDEARIRKTIVEKAEVRRRRREEQQNFQGELMRDSAFQELSGTGLRSKIIDGNNVELEWVTGSESNTKGFIVKRRAAKTADFEVLASYQTFPSLSSKGSAGGIYRYLDEDVVPGSYVYRVTECDQQNVENDLSQCLVDVQTKEEKIASLVAAVGITLVAVGALSAGVFLDPMQY